ncbi:hypothetical protein EJ08DRAFT_666735 [Tothia fuscella]|uniref:Uncharacterized protein n=1 Tax=Tothia fuscella TaxID=1048955 RepID=A0A9P4NDU4_9PEZI|nr:hypothetical protein EJ08DRAFT_666735 [Tothia fuscella]
MTTVIGTTTYEIGEILHDFWYASRFIAKADQEVTQFVQQGSVAKTCPECLKFGRQLHDGNVNISSNLIHIRQAQMDADAVFDAQYIGFHTMRGRTFDRSSNTSRATTLHASCCTARTCDNICHQMKAAAYALDRLYQSLDLYANSAILDATTCSTNMTRSLCHILRRFPSNKAEMVKLRPAFATNLQHRVSRLYNVSAEYSEIRIDFQRDVDEVLALVRFYRDELACDGVVVPTFTSKPLFLPGDPLNTPNPHPNQFEAQARQRQSQDFQSQLLTYLVQVSAHVTARTASIRTPTDFL